MINLYKNSYDVSEDFFEFRKFSFLIISLFNFVLVQLLGSQVLCGTELIISAILPEFMGDLTILGENLLINYELSLYKILDSAS